MQRFIIYFIFAPIFLGSSVFSKVHQLGLNKVVDFAPMDSAGALEITCKIKSKSTLDIVLNFNSRKNIKTELGGFWRLAVASSHLFKENTEKTIIFLPDGRRFEYFQPALQFSRSEELPMQLYFDENKKIYTFYDNSLNRYIFHDGLLKKARIKGKYYKWKYKGRLCIEVVNEKNRTKLFKFHYNRRHKVIRSFEIPSRKYTLKYAQTKSKIPYLSGVFRKNKSVFKSLIKTNKERSELFIAGIDDRFSFNKKGIVSYNGDKISFKIDKNQKSFKRVRGDIITHEVTETPRVAIYTTPKESIRTDFLVTRKGNHVRKIYSLKDSKTLKEFFYNSSYKLIRELNHITDTETVYEISSGTIRKTSHYSGGKLSYTTYFDSAGKKISKEFASGLKITF